VAFIKEKHCLNCSTNLVNNTGHLLNYCPNCGQKNSNRKVGIGYFISELLGSFFNFDSKFFKSLFPLIFQPGKLTKQFNEGKRVRFLPPLRMYLFSSFLYFFVLSIFTNTIISSDASLQENINFTTDTTRLSNEMWEILSDSTKAKFKTASTPQQLKLLTEDENFMNAISFWQKFVLRTNSKIWELRSVPQTQFISQLLTNSSIMLFFLMPLFAFLLKLFYYKKSLYIDNLVHSLHIHTFIFLMSIVLILLLWLFKNELIVLLGVCLIPIYEVISFKKVFNQKILNTITNVFAINMLYLFFIAIGVFIILFSAIFQL